MLQTGRSRVRLPIVLLEFFSDIILPGLKFEEETSKMASHCGIVEYLSEDDRKKPKHVGDLSNVCILCSWNI
jgi:hypothetical protein